MTPIKIALLTSWPMDVRIGSGVVRMVQGMHQGLQQIGAQVRLYHPQFEPHSYLNLANHRLRFNRRMARVSFDDFQVILGFDFDGYALDPKYHDRYFVFNGGILADLIRFEPKKIQAILKHLSRRERQAMRNARAVFAPSRYTAQKINALYQIPKEKIRTVPLGLNREIRSALLGENSPKNPKEILCVAKQYPRKGIGDLIRAFAVVRKALPQSRLRIVGDGPAAGENRTLARQLGLGRSVVFEGDVRETSRLLGFYRRAGVFCLPSYHETFGLVFLEAMAHRLPIVAYAGTAIPEVVPEEAAELCPPGEVSCLARRLILLLTDTQRAGKCAAAGFQWVQKFTWSRTATMLLDHCQAVLNQ